MENAAVRIEFEVCDAGRSLWRPSSSKMDTTEKCFASHSSKKSSVLDRPANKCKVCRESNVAPGVVSQLPPLSAGVRGDAPSFLCHHLTLLIVISARAGSTYHLWRSWAFVQLRPWQRDHMPFPWRVVQVPAHFFLSSRFTSPGDAAYASRPRDGRTQDFGTGRSGVCEPKASHRPVRRHRL